MALAPRSLRGMLVKAFAIARERRGARAAAGRRPPPSSQQSPGGSQVQALRPYSNQLRARAARKTMKACDVVQQGRQRPLQTHPRALLTQLGYS